MLFFCSFCCCAPRHVTLGPSSSSVEDIASFNGLNYRTKVITLLQTLGQLGIGVSQALAHKSMQRNTTAVICCTLLVDSPLSARNTSTIASRTRRYRSNLLHQSHHVCSCPLLCYLAITDS